MRGFYSSVLADQRMISPAGPFLVDLLIVVTLVSPEPGPMAPM